ncbi:RNA 3'-terminal phosphate cyclase family protein [Pseudovirgaria hyperparasitica]|uniref:RNA 3'-terminal phosphate cyclase family protein n=1 Tax=Pseudovirgaria hyperparasitica TaxID=470096 RepID=A0A6A6VWM5_9PEZI|nr:RNA 3'-terminal phosphate cyclase family protein [Pseudovirgaria hyperparasitica]KAF2754114.1 RNA 3'-terminal phosphate cyclase family protein [Pseudovirgaria hyperparasitica]
MSTGTSQPPLKFTGHKSLVQRLVLSTLTGRPIRVSNIRSSSHTSPGLAYHETNFIRLLDSVTNGSVIDFSYTGSTIVYRPGLITGSAKGYGASGEGVIRHEIEKDCVRGISYFLVPLCMLAPFAKAPVNVLFTGSGVITSSTEAGDISVDTVRTAILPLYAHFGIQNKIELRILKRSCAGPGGKGGGGEVQLVFGHQVRLPKTIHILNPGRVKKVQGVASAVGVHRSNNERMIRAVRESRGPMVPDTYIYSDVSPAPTVTNGDKSNPNSGRKLGKGFGISLVAETNNGTLYSADMASPPGGEVPAEEIGKRCALQLLESIAQGGCISNIGAPTALTLMAMGSEDVGRLELGRDVFASEPILSLARDLRTFGASQWAARDSNATEEHRQGNIVVSVIGRGIGNVGRKIA